MFPGALPFGILHPLRPPAPAVSFVDAVLAVPGCATQACSCSRWDIRSGGLIQAVACRCPCLFSPAGPLAMLVSRSALGAGQRTSSRRRPSWHRHLARYARLDLSCSSLASFITGWALAGSTTNAKRLLLQNAVCFGASNFCRPSALA